MADVVVIDVEARDKTSAGLAKVNRSLGNTATRAGGLTGRIKGLSAAIGPAGLAGAAIAGAAAVGVKLVSSFLSGSDAIGKMSTATGISTTTLQEWAFAAEQSGTDINTVRNGVNRFARVISDASNGSMTATRSLEALGLSAEELGRLTPEEQVNALADAVAGVEDPTQRTALAQEVLGRAGADLIPFLVGGADGLRDLGVQAHEAGRILDEDAIRASERTNDAMNIFNSSLKGVVNQGIAALLPAIEGLATFLSGTVAPFMTQTLIPVMQRLITDGMQKVETFVKNDLIPIIEDLQEIFEVAWPIIKEAVRIAISLIEERVGGMIDTFKGIITFISGVFSGDWEKAWRGVRQAFAGAIRLMLAPLRTFLEVLAKVPFVGGGAQAALEALDGAVDKLRGETDEGEKSASRLAAALGSAEEQSRDAIPPVKELGDEADTAATKINTLTNEMLANAVASDSFARTTNVAAQQAAQLAVIQYATARSEFGGLEGTQLAALIASGPQHTIAAGFRSGLRAGVTSFDARPAPRTGGGGGGGGTTASSTPSGALAGGGGIQQLTRIAGQRLGEISAHTFFALEATREIAAFTNPEFLVKTMERGVYRGTLAALGEWQRLQPNTPPPALSGTEAVLNLSSPAQLGTTRSSNVGAPA